MNEQTQNDYTDNNDYEIAVIGAGGIGSHLVSALVPALHRGGLLDSTGGITIRVYDSDTVTEENLAHQRFNYHDVGMHKVAAIERSMRPFTGACLRVVACPWDVREADDMTPADLTVVAVDSPIARRVVHSSDTIFLDLRTLADGFIALDSSVDRDFVTRMTPDQPARSCQHDGAVKSGNIEFGFLLAAAHGAQWVLQSLRWMVVGHELAMPPLPQSANITFGTLGRMPLAEEELKPQGSVNPKLHPSNLITSCIDTNDHDSEMIREHVACLAKRRWWRAIWKLGDSMSREISVLIDAEDKLFVDVGTSGQVKMSPPEDAKIPFQLWLHSHPLDAYWSSTDRDTLGCYVGLILEAVVLGHDHYKHTAHSESPESSLEEEGPLASWSSEPTVLYADDPQTLGPEDRKGEGQT